VSLTHVAQCESYCEIKAMTRENVPVTTYDSAKNSKVSKDGA